MHGDFISLVLLTVYSEYPCPHPPQWRPNKLLTVRGKARCSTANGLVSQFTVQLNATSFNTKDSAPVFSVSVKLKRQIVCKRAYLNPSLRFIIYCWVANTGNYIAIIYCECWLMMSNCPTWT